VKLLDSVGRNLPGFLGVSIKALRVVPSWALWHTPVILALRRITNLRLAWAI
jgi:hypothetical protein